MLEFTENDILEELKKVEKFDFMSTYHIIRHVSNIYSNILIRLVDVDGNILSHEDVYMINLLKAKNSKIKRTLGDRYEIMSLKHMTKKKLHEMCESAQIMRTHDLTEDMIGVGLHKNAYKFLKNQGNSRYCILDICYKDYYNVDCSIEYIRQIVNDYKIQSYNNIAIKILEVTSRYDKLVKLDDDKYEIADDIDAYAIIEEFKEVMSVYKELM